MNKQQMTGDEGGQSNKLYTPVQNMHAKNGLSKGNTITISSHSILIGIFSGLMIVSSFIMSIRSEINSSQAEYRDSLLIDQIKQLEEKVQKQITTTQSNDQTQQYQELQKQIMANTFQIQTQNSNISNLKDKQSDYQSLLNDFAQKQNSSTYQNDHTNRFQDIEKQIMANTFQIQTSNSQISNLKDKQSDFQSLLDELAQKQNSSTYQNDQTQRFQELDKQILTHTFLIQASNDNILHLKDGFTGFSQLKVDLAVQKEKLEGISKQFEKFSTTSIGTNTYSTTSSNISIDQIDLKITSAISSLQLEISKEISLLNQTLTVSTYEIQRLQKDVDPVLLQIAQLAPMNVEIINIKKNIIDLQTSLNDHIKSLSSTQANAESTSSPAQSTTSGSNGSTSTTPASTSPSTTTEDELETQIYGPYHSPVWQQIIFVTSTDFATVDTTEPCVITVKKKAIISLTASGLGLCPSCWGWLTFKKNGKINLPLTNLRNYPFGVSSFFEIWHTINYTQDFVVEAGTYVFEMGVGILNTISSVNVSLDAIQFSAKVTYN